MRDYANSQSTSRPPRRKKPFLTVLIIILAIAVPATLFYVRYQHNVHKKEAAAVKPIAIPSSSKQKPKTQKPETKYDFYTILPKKK